MMFRHVALAAVALTLVACGKKEEQTITVRDPQTGEKVDVGVGSADKGQVTFKSKDGSVVVNSGANAKLPAGFIGYPGAEVVTSMLGNSKEGAGGMVSMTTKDAPATVLAYYKKELAAKGMAIKMESTLPTGGMIIAGGDNEGDKGAMVTADSSKPGETFVSVVMNAK
jgi:hypothetical protein